MRRRADSPASWCRSTEAARKLVGHSGTEARYSDARCSRCRRHGSRGSSASHRSRYSGQKDPTCGRDYGRQKGALEFLDPVVSGGDGGSGNSPGSGESGSGALGTVFSLRGGSEGVAGESSSRGSSEGVAVESSSRGSSDGVAVVPVSVSSSRVSSDGEAFDGIVIRSVTRSSESMSVLSRVGTDGRALTDV